MCGIVGFWSNFRDEVNNQIYIKKMSKELNHRGPDYGGYWNDKSESFYISHRRLSILDLSVAGNQPMLSHSGRFVISFNGEIYNHIEIKKFLEKENKVIKWRGHSDTEILIELIESCEIARYTPASTDDMDKDYEKAVQILTNFENV